MDAILNKDAMDDKVNLLLPNMDVLLSVSTKKTIYLHGCTMFVFLLYGMKHLLNKKL